MGKLDLKDFREGDQGILYKASIFPWKIKKGEISILEFHVINPTKNVLSPAIYIPKVGKKVMLGRESFKPLSTKKFYFWVPDGVSLSKMEPGDQKKVYMPVFTSKYTEDGEYRIFIEVKIPKKGTTAGDVAKAVGKIALAFTIGYYSTKRYLPLKIEKSVGEFEGKNKFVALIGLSIDNYGKYIPKALILDFRRDLRLITNDHNGIVDIYTQKTENEEQKLTLLDTYKKLLPENPDEVTSMDIDDISFDVYHKKITSKEGGIHHSIAALGYADFLKRVVYFNAKCTDNLYSQTMSLLSSIKFKRN